MWDLLNVLSILLLMIRIKHMQVSSTENDFYAQKESSNRKDI